MIERASERDVALVVVLAEIELRGWATWRWDDPSSTIRTVFTDAGRAVLIEAGVDPDGDIGTGLAMMRKLVGLPGNARAVQGWQGGTGR